MPEQGREDKASSVRGELFHRFPSYTLTRRSSVGWRGAMFYFSSLAKRVTNARVDSLKNIHAKERSGRNAYSPPARRIHNISGTFYFAREGRGKKKKKKKKKKGRKEKKKKINRRNVMEVARRCVRSRGMKMFENLNGVARCTRHR